MRIILLLTSIIALQAQEQNKVPDFTVQELKALMKSGRDFILLDARKEKAFKAGHIKGAVNQYARERKLKPLFEKLKKRSAICNLL
jgi:rhodanese-related sulfurtransferase